MTPRPRWPESQDDVEWITPGNSAISGTVHGKQEVGALWAQLAEKGFTTSPQHSFSDEDRVVVLTQITVGGEPADQADVLTYRDGKLGQVPDGGRHRPTGGLNAIHGCRT